MAGWTNITRNLRRGCVLVAALFVVSVAAAQNGVVVPQRVPYQGMLPGVTGTHDIEVQIHDAAENGALVWNKAFAGVEFVDERFAVILEGASDSDANVSIVDAFTNPERYVEILVDGVSTGVRQRLASAPYAVVAQNFVPDESGNETFSFIPNAATIELSTPLDRRDFSNPDDVNTVLAAQIAGFALRPGSLLQVIFQAHGELSPGGSPSIVETLSTTATIVIDHADNLEPPIVIEQVLAAGPARLNEDTPTYFWNTETLRAQWLGPAFNADHAAEVDVSIFLTYLGPQRGDEYTERMFTLQEVFQQHEALRTVPPTADFSSSPSSPEPFPVTVQFTDESEPGSAPIDSWRWDFGDGLGVDPSTGEARSTSNLQNPMHRYTEPGEYAVTLTVTTLDGEHTTTKQAFVVVEELK